MSFVAIVTGVVSAGVGIYKAVRGKKAADAAAEQADKARVEMERHRAEYEKLDTSNPYLGMQNQYSSQRDGADAWSRGFFGYSSFSSNYGQPRFIRRSEKRSFYS